MRSSQCTQPIPSILSRARAYAFSGNDLREDRWCLHRPGSSGGQEVPLPEEETLGLEAKFALRWWPALAAARSSLSWRRPLRPWRPGRRSSPRPELRQRLRVGLAREPLPTQAEIVHREAEARGVILKLLGALSGGALACWLAMRRAQALA